MAINKPGLNVCWVKHAYYLHVLNWLMGTYRQHKTQLKLYSFLNNFVHWKIPPIAILGKITVMSCGEIVTCSVFK